MHIVLNPKFYWHTKHIDLQFHMFWKNIQWKEIALTYIYAQN
jgi:hypothetical protein